MTLTARGGRHKFCSPDTRSEYDGTCSVMDQQYVTPFRLIRPHSVFSGPAAFRQRSQRSVPLTLSTQHAEQSGARPAALEEAGPGTEEVRVRPPCCSQLNCPADEKLLVEHKKTTKKHCDRALNLYRFLSLICGSSGVTLPR